MKKEKTKSYGMPNLLSSILLIIYGFITVLTPNMLTFDSNGPKFMTLAMLNLLVFLLLFFVADGRENRKKIFGFLDNRVGLSYAILIVLSLLSFSKSININESILHFAKIFTTFSAAWFVYILVRIDKKSLVPLAVAMSLLLIVDGIQVYGGVADYVAGKLPSIRAFKASYSNANILTSAIFVKLPFALWLSLFFRKWLKYVGLLGLFFGILATFFMSSRAFYLGVIFISLLLIVYTLIIKKRQKNAWKNLAIYFCIVISTFLIFSVVENYFYPQSGKDSFGFTSRLSTVTDKDSQSNNLRLTAWGQSLTMIKKDPLLGVGLGNWKLRVLEYENKYSPTYTYMYKNHNDFLEITAESGVLAGISFILIFIFILWYLLVVLLKKTEEERLKYFFLPAFGIIAYSFDAFFNFPQDRPEIQSLFALYVGIAVGVATALNGADSPFANIKNKKKNWINTILIGVMGIVLVGSVFILYLNVKSLKLQRVVKEDINNGKLKSQSSKFIKGFPPIPDITVLAEPIAVQKARYLINEKKFKEARKLLKNDKANPFDGRKEYFIAMSYYTQKQYDSAIVYALKAREIKPYFYNNNTIITSVYEKKGEFDKSIELWRGYVKKIKNKPQAWIIPITLLEKQARLKEALSLADSAHKALPENSEIINKRILLKQKLTSKSFLKIYQRAITLYNNKLYKQAIPVFTEFLEKAPEYAIAYEFRGISYYKTGKFKECLQDVLKEESLGYKLKPNVINIKAACYFMLNDKKKAEKYFKESMDLGDKDGKNNYNKYFKGNKQKKISFSVPEK